MKCGTNVNAKDEVSYYVATYHLTSFVCINVQDKWTPLHLAASFGHSSTVESLVKSGANINAKDDVSCITQVITSHYNDIMFDHMMFTHQQQLIVDEGTHPVTVLFYCRLT